MEVSVVHTQSGRSCVVCVGDTDTVLDLKRRALEEIFAVPPRDGRVAARIGGGEGEGDGAKANLDDAQRIADTGLEAGGHVQLVPYWPSVKAPAEYDVGRDSVQRMKVSPCGTLCAVGTECSFLHVFNTTTAERVAQMNVGHTYIRAAAFSTCGKRLACATASLIAVYCTSTWRCVCTLEGHTSGVSCAAWTHCGRVVSGSDDKTIRVWDAEGVCTAVLQGHADRVCTIDVSSSDIYSGSNDGTIRVWDLANLSHTDTLAKPAVRAGGVGDVALCSDETCLVSCYINYGVMVWCTASLQCLWQTVPFLERFRKVAVSQEGDVVAASTQNAERLYTLSTGEPVGVLTGPPAASSPIALSPCGRWLFYTGRSSVSHFDTAVHVTAVSRVPPPPDPHMETVGS